MAFQTLLTIGLLTQMDLLTHSHWIKANGSIQITTVTVIISNISTVKLFASLTAVIVAERLSALLRLTAGVVLTATRTVGLTQPIRGWLAQVATVMPGQWTTRSGTMLTVMAEAIIHSERLQMFAQAKQVHRLAHPLVVTAGAVLIPMVTDGQTSVMHSFTSQPNGETQTGTASVMM
jgi:hypothetical protein